MDTQNKIMQKTRRCLCGFTMIEMLIALFITSILVVAVGVAFDASITSYTANRDIYNSLNKARQALVMMTPQLRTAQAVDPTSPANECALQTSAGDFITYRYDAASESLYLDKDDSSYLMCDNVTALSFSKSTDAGMTYVKSVLISITVQCNDVEETLASAAVVRRNLD